MKTLIKLVIVTLTLGMYVQTFSSEMITIITYKWTDDQGIIQYTERPPKNTPYEKITVNASGGQEVINVDANKNIPEENDTTKTALDDVVEANQRNCKIAKQNLEVLTKMARIRVTGTDGEERILSPEEKHTREKETQQQIDIYCKDIRQG